MKLIYIANARIPTEKAHGIQIMQMLNAFANSQSQIPNSKLDVELVIPWRFNPIKQGPFEYYDVPQNFKIIKIPSLDLVVLGVIGFLIQSFSFAIGATFYTLLKRADIIYSRDELPLFCLSFLGKKNLFWESHTAKKNFIVKRVLKKCQGIIVITKGLKNFYVKEYGINPDKILVAPDGVDIEKFQVPSSKFKIREKFGLPSLDKNLIGYVGMLKTMGMEKGIGTAIDSLKFLDENCILVLVGGHSEDIVFYKNLSERLGLSNRVLFTGYVRHQLVPLYLKSFNILIAPFPDLEHYRFYMSPLKIFEYMASGVPIVASDLPSLGEILNENNAVLVESNNPEALANGIKKVLQDKELADKISRQAFQDVQQYTWQKRTRKIIEFILK